MRVFNIQQVARPIPVDRGPSNKTNEGAAAAVAPHGYTARWTYTVPALKKAIIQTTRLVVMRNTAAAPVGQCLASLNYTPSGGGATTLVQAQLNTNGALDIFQTNITQLGDMLAGDALQAADSDTSTGGTVTFSETSKMFEYTA